MPIVKITYYNHDKSHLLKPSNPRLRPIVLTKKPQYRDRYECTTIHSPVTDAATQYVDRWSQSNRAATFNDRVCPVTQVVCIVSSLTLCTERNCVFDAANVDATFSCDVIFLLTVLVLSCSY